MEYDKEMRNSLEDLTIFNGCSDDQTGVPMSILENKSVTINAKAITILLFAILVLQVCRLIMFALIFFF